MSVREVGPEETAAAAPALLELRPHLGDAGTLVHRIDEIQRPQGYRLAASFEPASVSASAAAGFRVTEALAWGRTLYVDDLVTMQAHRGRGHARALLDWLVAEAMRLRCDEVHLDSAVGPHRADAHRLYLNSGLAVTSLHFSRSLRPDG